MVGADDGLVVGLQRAIQGTLCLGDAAVVVAAGHDRDAVIADHPAPLPPLAGPLQVRHRLAEQLAGLGPLALDGERHADHGRGDRGQLFVAEFLADVQHLPVVGDCLPGIAADVVDPAHPVAHPGQAQAILAGGLVDDGQLASQRLSSGQAREVQVRPVGDGGDGDLLQGGVHAAAAVFHSIGQPHQDIHRLLVVAARLGIRRQTSCLVACP